MLLACRRDCRAALESVANCSARCPSWRAAGLFPAQCRAQRSFYWDPDRRQRAHRTKATLWCWWSLLCLLWLQLCCCWWLLLLWLSWLWWAWWSAISARGANDLPPSVPNSCVWAWLSVVCWCLSWCSAWCCAPAAIDVAVRRPSRPRVSVQNVDSCVCAPVCC